ncbi:MAG: hypothetical protein IPM97_02970 [Bdellovibrionaceae bacterium]|nr:hypothetical protein [Pseudobdellovibrionaceae bacterium]
MKQIITLSAILALTACSESRKSLEGEMTFADSVKTSNIVGGTPFQRKRTLAKRPSKSIKSMFKLTKTIKSKAWAPESAPVPFSRTTLF